MVLMAIAPEVPELGDQFYSDGEITPYNISDIGKGR